MSKASIAATGQKPPDSSLWSRRRALMLGGGAVTIGVAIGAGVSVLARRPRRAEGLPQSINIAAAREIGDGFYLADGWVLTAEDLRLLQAAR